MCALAGTFIPINATFNGLFYETNNSWMQSSGIMTITTTARGKYTAKVQVGTARYALVGQFNPDGTIVPRNIPRRNNTPLTVQFQVDPQDPDLITGSVSDGTWTADMYADRAVFNIRTNLTSDAGRYTMVLLGDFTSSTTPGGDSYGTILIDKVGRLLFAGFLADGTKLVQSATVAKGGQWPLYSPLYGGRGSLYGWLLFNGSADDDLSGDATWIRPEMLWTWYYPHGFATIASALGSRYTTPPRGTKVLNLTSAEVEFNGGDLGQDFTNHVTMDAYNRITNLDANGLHLGFSLANGVFSGSVRHPVTWDVVPFRGVVLQKYGVAAGYFPAWTQTGEVWLEGQ
jgi:hypothetical protein